MKYKVNKGTELFDKLVAFQSKMTEVNNKALELCKELGGKRFSVNGEIAGGISSIEFDEQPKGWRKTSLKGFYQPSDFKKNKEVIDKMRSLPRLSFKDFNEIVGYELQFVGNMICTMPQVFWKKDFVLLSFNEAAKYTPVEDMEEITVSEFNSLKES